MAAVKNQLWNSGSFHWNLDRLLIAMTAKIIRIEITRKYHGWRDQEVIKSFDEAKNTFLDHSWHTEWSYGKKIGTTELITVTLTTMRQAVFNFKTFLYKYVIWKYLTSDLKKSDQIIQNCAHDRAKPFSLLYFFYVPSVLTIPYTLHRIPSFSSCLLHRCV